MIAVILVLIVAVGLFAVGFIPPVAHVKGHTSSGTGTSGIRFVTYTTTVQGPAQTTTVQGTSTINSTLLLTSTTTTTSSTTSTSTASETTTLTSTSVTTLTSTTTSTTTTTKTSTTTTTSSLVPTEPLEVNFSITPAGNPGVFFAGEPFTITVTVKDQLASPYLFLDAYQYTPGDTPQVVSFYPPLPEQLQPVVGVSTYVIQGSISQNSPVGNYQFYVSASAGSPQNATTVNVSQQYIAHVLEPLSFNGYTFVNPTSQFSGSCTNQSLVYSSGATSWIWGCLIDAAPNESGLLNFTVTNLASIPICIQTSLGAASATGYVDMDPYPFCPNGAPGVYVPPSVTNWPFTFDVENGNTAGNQTVYFTFTR